MPSKWSQLDRQLRLLLLKSVNFRFDIETLSDLFVRYQQDLIHR